MHYHSKVLSVPDQSDLLEAREDRHAIKAIPDTDLPDTATNPPETLNRSLTLRNSLTIGFATVSPVAGLYAIIGVQTVVTGGGRFGALALCLVMQLLVVKSILRERHQKNPLEGVSPV